MANRGRPLLSMLNIQVAQQLIIYLENILNKEVKIWLKLSAANY